VLFTWKKTLLFVAGTTLVLLVLNWLILSDILPIKKTIDYSAVQANFIQFWIKLAAFIGLLLPVIALFVWWRYLGYSRDTGKIGHDVKFCNNARFSMSLPSTEAANTQSAKAE
jgi:hypothetical protein